jgi:hypothetical protein
LWARGIHKVLCQQNNEVITVVVVALMLMLMMLHQLRHVRQVGVFCSGHVFAPILFAAMQEVEYLDDDQVKVLPG